VKYYFTKENDCVFWFIGPTHLSSTCPFRFKIREKVQNMLCFVSTSVLPKRFFGLRGEYSYERKNNKDKGVH